jgi:hypothetical protein
MKNVLLAAALVSMCFIPTKGHAAPDKLIKGVTYAGNIITCYDLDAAKRVAEARKNGIDAGGKALDAEIANNTCSYGMGSFTVDSVTACTNFHVAGEKPWTGYIIKAKEGYWTLVSTAVEGEPPCAD